MPKSKPILLIIILTTVLIAGGGVYIYYVRYVQPKIVHNKYQEIIQRISAFTPKDIDLQKASQELEALLDQYSGTLSKGEEGQVEIYLADAVSAIDRKKSIGILKKIITDPAYPANLKAMAINILIDSYEELNFLGPNFTKQEDLIFTGDYFEKALFDAGKNTDLAIRKLNERSVDLFPNAVAYYRIAKWYAAELYTNPSSLEREEYLQETTENIAAGDELFSRFGSVTKRSRVGLAYELKSRALYLSGNIDAADESFKKAVEVLRTAPVTAFQMGHLARTSLFYAAFLARNYGNDRAEDIELLLRPIYNRLETPQDPRRRGIRIVSLLAAARDSHDVNYPFVDFNGEDIARFYKIYPRSSEVINRLNFIEYIRSHPIAAELEQ